MPLLLRKGMLIHFMHHQSLAHLPKKKKKKKKSVVGKVRAIPLPENTAELQCKQYKHSLLLSGTQLASPSELDSS